MIKCHYVDLRCDNLMYSMVMNMIFMRKIKGAPVLDPAGALAIIPVVSVRRKNSVASRALPHPLFPCH
jgi:hypothetical protein